MLADDLPGRFDYLFEPLETDESAGNGDDDRSQATAQPEDNDRWSRRLVLAGVVLATLGVADGDGHRAAAAGPAGTTDRHSE